MQIEYHYRDDICILRLEGRFRTGSNREFAQVCQQLNRRGVRKVMADLAGVPYLDSTGLAFVVGLHNILEAQGGWLMLASLTERSRAILRLTRLDERIPVVVPASRSAAA